MTEPAPHRDGYIYLVTSVASVGGLLFGYDTAVISGAIGFLQTKFQLGAAWKGWAASSALVGCIAGAMMAGTLSDRLGRKKVLILAALLFSASALGTALPRNLFEFSAARIAAGVAVGIASMLSPLYISEIAPARLRGRLVSLNQLTIVSGMLLVYFANERVAAMGDEAWNVAAGWRWMFGLGLLPSALFLVLLFSVPESPRWLVKQGREEEALDILERVNGPERAHREIETIRETIAMEGGSLVQLFNPGMRQALIIGVALAILQQVTGINAILYYAPEIFKSSGAGIGSAMLQTVLVGAVNVGFTLVAIWLVDKAGRKALLLGGSAAMTLSLLAIGISFHLQKTESIWVLLSILVYIASFACSLGPVVWVVMAEIFPTRIRGRAMSVATTILWCSCFLVSQTFPILDERLGSAGTFFIYAIFSGFTFGFVLRVVPETKGKMLEEIERSWTHNPGPAPALSGR